MRFARAFGGYGDAPGQFTRPQGVAIVRGMLVVSEEKRLQVLTSKGTPLQVIALGDKLRRTSADEKYVWVADATRDGSLQQVHCLSHA